MALCGAVGCCKGGGLVDRGCKGGGEGCGKGLRR